eukprot:TRINITY_DN1510_c0_g1_i6.p1 TRINITY_DN1510_c0_g1~~TRINITY_DN1510_c0_g1_i6.p1  ORF type:complete len:152 (-),score=8.82 TRINITY_DN1510_c0_g1_i6:929-1384(-)
MKSAPHQCRALSVQSQLASVKKLDERASFPSRRGETQPSTSSSFTPSSANQATCTDLGACHGKTRDANRYFAVQLYMVITQMGWVPQRAPCQHAAVCHRVEGTLSRGIITVVTIIGNWFQSKVQLEHWLACVRTAPSSKKKYQKMLSRTGP